LESSKNIVVSNQDDIQVVEPGDEPRVVISRPSLTTYLEAKLNIPSKAPKKISLNPNVKI
jgi:hypothetical protein